MKVLVISGFLGAGKTTFIREMMKATGREFVVFENEFADVNIDGALLQASRTEEQKELEVYELSNGCICCSMQGDFTASLLVISNSLDPDFLIVEPSGVAVLSAVLDNVRQVEYERIRLLDPISLVDATTYWRYKEKYQDTFLDQIRATRSIQLSKTEQMEKEEIFAVEADLRALNPEAQIWIQHYKNASKEYWDSLFQGELKYFTDPHLNPELQLENFSYRAAFCPTFGQFWDFLQELSLGMYGDVCRAKGVVETLQGKLRFDLVDRCFEITDAGDEEENQLIFIGKDLNRLRLKAKWASFKGALRLQDGLKKGRCLRLHSEM